MTASFLARAVRRVALSGLVLLAGMAAACGHFGLPGSDPERAAVVFTNESLDQANVFAVTGSGQTVRIGTVMAGRTATLLLPADMVNRAESIDIVARLLAGRAAPRTGSISVHPGERVQVRLPIDERTLVVLPAP